MPILVLLMIIIIAQHNLAIIAFIRTPISTMFFYIFQINCVFIYPESSLRTFVTKTQVQFLEGKVLHLYKDTHVKTYKEAEFTFNYTQRNNLERNG